jgi:hypothetical protein
MAKKQLTISIPTPCTEDWNAMTPDKNGKFCASCQKTVVDFTRMSDAEIFRYFDTFKGNACGRFSEKQLSAPIIEPLVLKPLNRWAWALSALLLPSVAASQTAKMNEATKIITPSVFEQKKSKKSLIIEGEVAELGTQLPLQNALISIVINGKVVMKNETNKDGYFKINLPTAFKNQQFNIVVENKGMEKQSLHFDTFTDVLNSRLFIKMEKAKIIKLAGTVVDSNFTNDALVGASIIVDETNMGTLADLDGHFELEISTEKVDIRTCSISVASYWYESKSLKLDVFEENKDLKIALKGKEILDLELIVGYVTTYKKSNFLQRTKYRIRNFFRRLRGK